VAREVNGRRLLCLQLFFSGAHAICQPITDEVAASVHIQRDDLVRERGSTKGGVTVPTEATSRASHVLLEFTYPCQLPGTL